MKKGVNEDIRKNDGWFVLLKKDGRATYKFNWFLQKILNNPLPLVFNIDLKLNLI